MAYIYFPVAYYHLNLDVTKGTLLAAGFSAVPAVFLVIYDNACIYFLDLSFNLS